jgi:hypothetical protein
MSSQPKCGWHSAVITCCTQHNERMFPAFSPEVQRDSNTNLAFKARHRCGLLLRIPKMTNYGVPSLSGHDFSPHRSITLTLLISHAHPISVGSCIRVAYVKPSDSWQRNAEAGAKYSLTQVRKGSNRSPSHTASRVGSVNLVSGLHSVQTYPPGTRFGDESNEASMSIHSSFRLASGRPAKTLKSLRMSWTVIIRSTRAKPKSILWLERLMKSSSRRNLF